MQRALDSSLSAPGPAHRTAPQRTAPQRTAEMTFVRWFFSLAIAPFVYASAEAGASEYTYQHEGRTCRRCPPGQYMKTRCTRSHDTICAPCSANHYTQYWNYIQKCQYCNNFCQENQYVKSECNQFHNRVCECKDGYFWKYEFCMKHKECPQGFGVTAPGTPHEDTVCTKCHPGFFSSVSSASYISPALCVCLACILISLTSHFQLSLPHYNQSEEGPRPKTSPIYHLHRFCLT